MEDSLSAISSLYKPSELTEFLESHGLRLTKALGQHFFIERRMLEHILTAAGFPTEGPILEIGPGIGHLTWALIARGLSVYAVEKDNTFIRMLDELAATLPERSLTIYHQDALQTDFAALARETGAIQVIGNLPYNVAVPILFQVAYSGFPFEKIGVMIQKEVGERIMADAGNNEYGRLSIVLKYLYNVKRIKTIPPTCFFPRPKVESVFIALTPKENTDLAFCRNYLERAALIGFQHRRKKLRSQFKGSIVQKRILSNHLDSIEAEFNLDQRAEEWPVAEWIRFAEFIRDRKEDE